MGILLSRVDILRTAEMNECMLLSVTAEMNECDREPTPPRVSMTASARTEHSAGGPRLLTPQRGAAQLH